MKLLKRNIGWGTFRLKPFQTKFRWRNNIISASLELLFHTIYGVYFTSIALREALWRHMPACMVAPLSKATVFEKPLFNRQSFEKNAEETRRSTHPRGTEEKNWVRGPVKKFKAIFILTVAEKNLDIFHTGFCYTLRRTGSSSSCRSWVRTFAESCASFFVS